MTFVGTSSQWFFAEYEVRNLVQASLIYQDRQTSWLTRLDFQSITMEYSQPIECAVCECLSWWASRSCCYFSDPQCPRWSWNRVMEDLEMQQVVWYLSVPVGIGR